MKADVFAELRGMGSAQPAFEGIQVQAELRETLAITTITQSYRNAGSRNIEVIYTFPLPLDAVLLEMEVTLGGKTLKGTVLPKKVAEGKYEDAVIDGDAPAMLENLHAGLYTMNVGSLLPDEKARITIRYAMFQRWQGDTLRYLLPTTIAPRYGSPRVAGLQPLQEPQTSLLAENLFTFEMRIVGGAAGRDIVSPSHEIVIAEDSDGGDSLIRLSGASAFMDRDLVITVRRGDRKPASAVTARDGDGYLLWGSFHPQFDLADDPVPRSVKIVVDCSGSMGGDSITQAREALMRVLDELRHQDWFNVVTFGSSATVLFNRQARAGKENLYYARRFLERLAADMGGTEMGLALEVAERLRCPEKVQQDVLLVTDGEIWEWEKVVARSLESKHRFFTVGVGNSVSEAFLQTLAERTGGACELVSPNEDLAECIHRQFKRIGTPCSSNSEITWPAQPVRVFPEVLPVIYNGDTCNLFAWFPEPPLGEVSLQVSLSDGSRRVMSAVAGPCACETDPYPAIARMAAALKLREIGDEKAGQSLAVRYQLVSKWTNYLAIAVRDEDGKAASLPALQRVQQMLAAGWGGFGSAKTSPMSMNREVPTFMRAKKTRQTGMASALPFWLRDMDSPDQAPPAPPPGSWIWDYPQHSPGRFLALLETILHDGVMPTAILLPLLPFGIENVLAQLVDEGIDERVVVMLFLHFLAGSIAGNVLSRQAKRVIVKACKELEVDSDIARTIKERLSTTPGEMQLKEDQYEIYRQEES